MAGQTLIGRIGSVTIRVPGGERPGEIQFVMQGIRHHYIAYCREPVAVGERVLVIDERGFRQVDVEPWQDPERDLRPELPQ